MSSGWPSTSTPWRMGKSHTRLYSRERGADISKPLPRSLSLSPGSLPLDECVFQHDDARVVLPWFGQYNVCS
jgi:hypothetical protein